jgi:hypothetical protein
MFYLGLEARQRENIYNDFSECLDDAVYISQKLLIPIRIFTLLPNRKSQLVKIVQPGNGRRPLSKKTCLEESTK